MKKNVKVLVIIPAYNEEKTIKIDEKVEKNLDYRKQFGIDEDTLINMTFGTVIFGIIGARLYYVLFNLPYYSKNIVEIFEIWNGGLAIHGGIITAIITTLVYCKIKKFTNKLAISIDIC